jgi:tetratricopeptide (TPR) repeat protein
MSVKPINIRKRPIKTYLFLFFISFILYANTVGHEYAWDDKIVIEKNPRVQKGMAGIPDLFVKHASQFQYDKYGYRPITLTSFAIDYSLAKGNPHFSHFMNAFYYAVLCVLIFIFISALFTGYHPVFAWLVTLLFMAHPLHVEAVANIKSRDEIFVLLFSIASFIYFIKYLEGKKILHLLYVFGLYLLAYLSKENAITGLAVFPCLLWLKKTKGSLQPIWWTSATLVAMLVISLVIFRMAAQSTVGSEASAGKGIYEENGILGNSFFFLYGWSQKIPNALHLLGLYLKNFLIPYPLRFYYGYNQIPVTGWGNIMVIGALLVHIALLVTGIKYIKKRPEILFGFIFYAASISVYLHLFRPFSDTMADRFLFTGSLGLCLMLVGILALILKIEWVTTAEKKPDTKPGFQTFIKNKTSIVYPVLGLAFIFSILTISRNRVWKDDLTLITHDLPYLENCARVHYYYASLLNNQLLNDKTLFNNASKRQKIEAEMIKQYKRSMEISDYAYLSYLELGTYYCRNFNYNEGIPILKKGVELFPEASDISFYLGQTYVLTEQNQLAVPLLEKSIKLSYNQSSSYYFLALAYGRTGRLNDALRVVDDGMKRFENEKLMFYDALGFIYFDNNLLDKSIESTLKMKDYGKPEKDVYGYIIGRCYTKGDTAKGNIYREEARLKGIIFQ